MNTLQHHLPIHRKKKRATLFEQISLPNNKFIRCKNYIDNFKVGKITVLYFEALSILFSLRQYLHF